MDPSWLNVTAQIEGIELIILLIILAVLFLFGPSKIPDMARGLGRAMGEFKKARMEIEKEIQEDYAGVSEQVAKIEKELKVK